jgi:hypothetical protein
MSEQPPATYKIYVDKISMTGSGGEVTGMVADNMRPVVAIVDLDNAQRLRGELAAQPIGFTGQEPPSVTVPVQAIKWLGDLRVT